MNSIVQHIEYLISVNDCVVIPQWGALIARYESARFDDAVITSPARHISFNSQVSHNDGLLAHSLMRRNGISYDRAMDVIGAGVVNMKQQLKTYGTIPLGSVGLFTQSAAGVEFTPFKNGVAGEYYGLTDFCLKRVDVPAEQNETATVITFDPRRAVFKKAIRVAASIALLIGLGIVLSTPVIDQRVQQAGLNMPVTKPALTTTVTTTDDNATIATETRKTPDQYRYQLVVGTFDTRKTASEFIAAHSELGKIEIVKIGKRYRLIAAYTDSRDEIVRAQAALPDKCQSWIAERK